MNARLPLLSVEESERVQLKSWHDYTLRKQAEARERVLARFSPMDLFLIEAYAEACAAQALARADLAKGAK